MYILFRGMESEERLDLLLRLTKIRSKPVIKALKDHLMFGGRGLDDALAAELNGVAHPNFTRALKRLNQNALIVEKIKEHDWKHLKRGITQCK